MGPRKYRRGYRQEGWISLELGGQALPFTPFQRLFLMPERQDYHSVGLVFAMIKSGAIRFIRRDWQLARIGLIFW